MKQLLLLIFIFIITTTCVLAMQDIQPRWDEFCPVRYLQPIEPVKPMSYEEIMAFLYHPYKFAYKNRVLWRFCNSWSYGDFVTKYPYYKDEKINNRDVHEYWSMRKYQFDQEMKTCSTSKDTATCYNQIRLLEQNKNADLEKHNDMQELIRTMHSSSTNYYLLK